MYDFSGIVYRLWAEAGAIALIGIACLLKGLGADGKSRKEDFLAAALCIGLSIVLCVDYLSCLYAPRISSFEGVFYKEHSNSRVAPPLPLTMEYEFLDENGKVHIFYLDVLSKKKIFPEGFSEKNGYTIWYEERSEIIVRVEKEIQK